MIKIGENVISHTDTEYGVEYVEPLIGLKPIVTMADSRAEAEMMAGILDGTVKIRTVYVSEWRDSE